MGCAPWTHRGGMHPWPRRHSPVLSGMQRWDPAGGAGGGLRMGWGWDGNGWGWDGDGMGMGVEMGMEMVGWALTPHSPPPIESSCVHW